MEKSINGDRNKFVEFLKHGKYEFKGSYIKMILMTQKSKKSFKDMNFYCMRKFRMKFSIFGMEKTNFQFFSQAEARVWLIKQDSRNIVKNITIILKTKLKSKNKRKNSDWNMPMPTEQLYSMFPTSPLNLIYLQKKI